MEKALEPEEVLRVAHAHLVNGVSQQAIAQLMNINGGRVSEACTAMEFAAANVKEIYEVARGAKKIVKDA